MPDDDGELRLNSSSMCTICGKRTRIYLVPFGRIGNPLALCPVCDCDREHQITYVKKRTQT